MADSKTILDEAQEKMDMAVMYLDEALAHIRAGKADIRLLDGIRVDSYGSMVPINNVASRQHTRCPQHRHQAVGQKHVPRHRKSDYRFRIGHHAGKQR